MRCVPSSQLVFGVLSQPLWSITCSLYFHVIAASSASHAPTCVCCHALRCFFASPLLLPKTNFFFWLRPKLFTIFLFLHQAVEAICILQSCTKLIPFALNRDCSHLRQISSSVQPCPSCASSSAFSWPSVMNFWTSDISLLSVLRRVRLPPIRLLDELCGTPPKSRSTSRRPSLLGQCTSFLPSTASQ